MKYLVLAVLLAVMQASPPVPRKPPNNKAAQGSKQQNNTDPEKSVSAPTAPPAPPQRDGSSNPSGPNNAEDNIRVRELPPVTVATDGWYIAYVILTGCLVVVGIGGVRAAMRTLKAIERQAKANEDQLIETQKASEEARRSAAFAELATKVSARANILLAAASIVSRGPVTGDSQLKVTYQNFGRTTARDVRFKVEMQIAGLILAKGNMTLPPLTMGAGQDQTITFMSFRECFTEQTFKEVVAGKRSLSFVASAVYEDVFGDSYTTLDIGVFEIKGLCFRIQQQIAG